MLFAEQIRVRQRTITLVAGTHPVLISRPAEGRRLSCPVTLLHRAAGSSLAGGGAVHAEVFGTGRRQPLRRVRRGTDRRLTEGEVWRGVRRLLTCDANLRRPDRNVKTDAKCKTAFLASEPRHQQSTAQNEP